MYIFFNVILSVFIFTNINNMDFLVIRLYIRQRDIPLLCQDYHPIAIRLMSLKEGSINFKLNLISFQFMLLQQRKIVKYPDFVRMGMEYTSHCCVLDSRSGVHPH
jgi:hypothetical protein